MFGAQVVRQQLTFESVFVQEVQRIVALGVVRDVAHRAQRLADPPQGAQTSERVEQPIPRIDKWAFFLVILRKQKIVIDRKPPHSRRCAVDLSEASS